MYVRVGLMAALVLSAGCSKLGVQAAAGLKFSVRVRWTQSSDPDVTGYRVYRGTTPDFALTGAPSVDVGPAITSALMTDVPIGKQYFKVVALGTIPAVNGVGGASLPVLVQVNVP